MNGVDRFLLHTALIDGVGPATVAPLVELLERNGESFVDTLYRASVPELIRYGLLSRGAHLVAAGLQERTKVEREVLLIERHGFAWVSCLDERFPPLLRAIHMPPLGLYCWGDVTALATPCMVACIGSRAADEYGLTSTRRLVTDLACAGATIVSGGARGIDGEAHRAALEAEGRTVVVLGSGLLRLYPAEHADLFKRVALLGGAVISVFPLHMDAQAGNFPARNRIISGLASATLVVQAARKSGALITAAYAIEQGRELCVVPGRIDNPLSEGCHDLVAQGALLAQSGAMILEALGFNVQNRSCVCPKVPVARTTPVRRCATSHEDFFVTTTEQEPRHKLLTFCASPRFFDELLEVGLYESEDALRNELCMLNFDGALSQDFMGRWVSTRS